MNEHNANYEQFFNVCMTCDCDCCTSLMSRQLSSKRHWSPIMVSDSVEHIAPVVSEI